MIFVSAVISIMSLFIGFATSLEAYTWFVLVIGFCALSASNVSQAVLSEAVPCKHRRVLVATKVRCDTNWSFIMDDPSGFTTEIELESNRTGNK